MAALVLAGLLSVAAVQANEADEVARLIQTGRSADALRVAEQRLSRTPGDTQLRFLRGVAMADLGRTTEAVAVFNKLIQEHPDLAEPYNNLAVLYAGMGQFDRARAALETAIRVNPGYSTAHENLGDLYATLASQSYSKAMQVDSAVTRTIAPKLALIRDLVASKGQTPAPAPAAPMVVQAAHTPVSAAPIAAAGPMAAMAPMPAAAAISGATTANTTANTATPEPVAAGPASAVAPRPATPSAAAPGPQKQATVAASKPAAAERNPGQSLLTRATEIEIRMAVEAWAEAQAARQAARQSDRRPAEVSLSDLRIDLRGSTAIASFLQTLRGDAQTATSRKSVRLVERDGRWRIEGDRTS